MAMLDPYKNWCGNLDVDVGWYDRVYPVTS
jgi:hypothetical protein